MPDRNLATRRDVRELEDKLTIRLGGNAVACTALMLALLPMLIR